MTTFLNFGQNLVTSLNGKPAFPGIKGLNILQERSLITRFALSKGTPTARGADSLSGSVISGEDNRAYL